jgi:CRISPR-associated protein Cas2
VVVKVYYVIVYDISVERLDDVRTFLRQYLNWVQNSVFEGELTPAQYTQVKEELKTLIDETDNVLIYETRSRKYLERESLGTPKASIDPII